MMEAACRRFYNYCPECGTYIFPKIKQAVLVSDDNATLKYDERKLP